VPPAVSPGNSFTRSDDTSAGPSTASRTTHFGFQEVPESLKESLVGSVFTSVSPKYDLLNDSMSLGIHRLWKDSFVSSMLPRLPPSLHEPRSPDEWKPSFQCLDVAGGTGDIALRILDRAREKYSNRDIRVEIVDINEGMLHEGRKRVAQTIYYNSQCP
jgi:2-methoxy-6-polyprenyl-1,4-benzoquinol methylase